MSRVPPAGASVRRPEPASGADPLDSSAPVRRTRSAKTANSGNADPAAGPVLRAKRGRPPRATAAHDLPAATLATPLAATAPLVLPRKADNACHHFP